MPTHPRPYISCKSEDQINKLTEQNSRNGLQYMPSSIDNEHSRKTNMVEIALLAILIITAAFLLADLMMPVGNQKINIEMPSWSSKKDKV